MTRAMLIEKRKTFTLYTKISLALTVILTLTIFLCLFVKLLNAAIVALVLAIFGFGLTLWLKKQATT